MRKIILPILFLLLPIFGTIAQEQNIRDMIAIVRPVYRESTVDFLMKFSESLRKDGYRDAADLLKSYAEGGFGSGFVYKDTEGKCYIVTNRHVVAQAKSATIEFSSANGATTSYKDCPIIAIDEDLDLALIAFNADVKLNAIPFAKQISKDGDDVFSAGFPGLGKMPSWQLGKGIVSNSSLQLEELANPQITSIIQHTAQIDPGSSGGPLLIKNENSPCGYEIVAINTWKARRRENANFAIPASAIHVFIEKSLTQKAIVTNEELEKRAREFVNATNTGYEKILKFVSYNYISSLSISTFQDLFKNASEEAREAILENFNNGYPIEGARVAIADAIYQRINKYRTTFAFAHIAGLALANNPTAVTFIYNKKEIGTSWVLEQNLWRLTEFSLLNMKDITKDGIASSFRYRGGLRVGVGIPLNDHEATSFEFGFIRAANTYLTSDFMFNIGKSKFDQNAEISTSNGHKDTVLHATANYVGFTYAFGGQLPIKISSIYLIPQAKVLAGIGVGEISNFYYGYSFGIQVAKRLVKDSYLILGVDFKMKYTIGDASFTENKYNFDNVFADSDIKLKPIPLFGIYAAITF